LLAYWIAQRQAGPGDLGLDLSRTLSRNLSRAWAAAHRSRLCPELRPPPPHDWEPIHRLEGSRAVLEAASAHHIPVRGIAVPIRDETTGDSLFNVNLDCLEAEWRLRSNGLGRDFMVVS